MGFLDLGSLHSLVLSTPCIKELYIAYPEQVLRDVTGRFGFQIQNLVLTARAVLKETQYGCKGTPSDLENMETYLLRNLDSEGPKRIVVDGSDALPILEDLAGLDSRLNELVQEYAMDTYNRACQFDNPGAVVGELTLSPSEHHRISRAFWLLQLYGMIFYDFADRMYSHANPWSNFTGHYFLRRLAVWELDEMVTVYQFMVRYRLSMSLIPCCSCHIGESDVPRPYSRNRDPLECNRCRGRFRQYRYQIWDFLDSYTRDRTYALEQQCNRAPAKLWPDYPSANLPGPGWSFFNNIRIHGSVIRPVYKGYFRNLGFFFWDRERLQRWHFFDLESSNSINAIWKQRDDQINEGRIFDFVEITQRGEEQNLINWTRCYVPCRYEDWLAYEKTQ
ncbi:hypothetical protein K432DRAFT_385753 [Lepidopterella palustris CBS 459.81]|uniref:Uncharacterized protein n=1 Tax=Lepidopterella palustris CBS 459.81 TaxID=1314670 RepID=A0A8E2E291_9PEZI|nr:hypothetical protein K432DRAFT_385753 [Lepidopterella palustris CBS 459.81]